MARKDIEVTANVIQGRNVYHTKNQTIYLDFLDKNAYIITNSTAKRFSQWQLRLPLCLIFACVLILFRINYFTCLLAGLIAYVISEYIFRTKFLPKLPISTNFVKPESKGFVNDVKEKYGKGKLQLLSIMFFALSLLMVVNLLISKYTGSALILNIVYIVIPLIVALVLLIIANKRD